MYNNSSTILWRLSIKSLGSCPCRTRLLQMNGNEGSRRSTAMPKTPRLHPKTKELESDRRNAASERAKCEMTVHWSGLRHLVRRRHPRDAHF